MAEKANQTVNQTANKSGTQLKEPQFFLHDLREHSQELFGVKPEVLDGAFLNVKKQQLTRHEAQKIINEFLKKEVK